MSRSNASLSPCNKPSTSLSPRDENTTTLSREEQRRKLALNRSKKLLQAKVMNRLIETQTGRDLLLGRALFKEQQKRLQEQQQENKIVNNNDEMSLSSSSVDGNNKATDEYANNLIQKYLEHRARRRSVAMKKRKEDIEKLAHSLNNDCSLSPIIQKGFVKKLVIEEEEQPKKSLSSPSSYHIRLDKSQCPSRPLILQSKAA